MCRWQMGQGLGKGASAFLCDSSNTSVLFALAQIAITEVLCSSATNMQATLTWPTKLHEIPVVRVVCHGNRAYSGQLLAIHVLSWDNPWKRSVGRCTLRTHTTASLFLHPPPARTCYKGQNTRMRHFAARPHRISQGIHKAWWRGLGIFEAASASYTEFVW